MKYILKNKEPLFLQKYKTGEDTSYDGYNDKVPHSNPTQHPVRDSLLDEQGHLCAYCMRRISLDYDSKLRKPKIEIEHYRSQKRFPNLDLDYKNMLGVCNGNGGKAQHLLTCDKAKSKHDIKGKKGRDLFVDPLEKSRELQIEYSNDGTILSDNLRIDDDLNEVLNLNQDQLKEDRRNLFQIEKRTIRNYKKKVMGDRPKVKAFLQKRKTDWESKTNNKFRPLCRIPLYVIEKEFQKYS
jgi:uncharacterized protein (TIGR02646 family)